MTEPGCATGARWSQRAAGMCLPAVALLVVSSGCGGILRGDSGSARPDLLVESITHSLSAPSPGAPVTFTVTVRNQGGADAGLFNVGFWSNRAAEPGLGDRPDASRDVAGLAIGDSVEVEFIVPAPAEGSYTAWAYADRFAGTGEVHESDEMNNAGPAGGYAWLVATSLVLNEVDPASADWCEIYNPFSLSVDMTGWRVEFGLTASAYYFPAGFTLPPNGYVEIRENSGADTAAVLYAGFNIGFEPTDGSVSLLDAGGIGVDFVRWGSSTDTPPAGTSWSGSIAIGPATGQTLGRDRFGTDTNDASDWENTCGTGADSPTPGAANWLPPTITVVSPNGGEMWCPGASETITWTSTSVPGNVDILYSTDAGSTWTPVDTNVANTGSYGWTVPVEDSPSCLVCVEETGGAGLSDTSDGVFTIAVPPCASFPFVEDFETGSLASYWSVSSTATGRAVVATANGPNGGAYHFLMDSSTDGSYALNELVLTIDLAGQSGVVLSFYCRDFGDEADSMPASFTGSSDSDGVAVSADGVTW
ncbi:MAG: CARDB domain-containing protein, partial [Planctomycetota bacterium]